MFSSRLVTSGEVSVDPYLSNAEDFDLWLALKTHHFLFLDEPLLFYRRHEASKSYKRYGSALRSYLRLLSRDQARDQDRKLDCFRRAAILRYSVEAFALRLKPLDSAKIIREHATLYLTLLRPDVLCCFIILLGAKVRKRLIL